MYEGERQFVLKNMVYQIRNVLNDPDADKTKMRKQINEAANWMDNNQAAEHDEFSAEKMKLAEVWMPTLIKANPELVTVLVDVVGGWEEMAQRSMKQNY